MTTRVIGTLNRAPWAMRTAHSPNPAAATIASRIGLTPADVEDRRSWGPLTAITPTTIAPIPTSCGQEGKFPFGQPDEHGHHDAGRRDRSHHAHVTAVTDSP